MGQKVHPIGFRLGVNRTWDSRWYAEGDYAELLHEDIKLRNYLKKRLFHAGISKIEIERAASKVKVNIFAARPGIIIGKKGAEVESLKKDLENKGKYKTQSNIIRSRNRWYKEGEKFSKYFLNIEKRNFNNKHIFKLQIVDSTLVTNVLIYYGDKFLVHVC